MKKLIIVCLVLLFIVGCGNNPTESKIEPTPTQTIVSTPTPAPTVNKMKDGSLAPGDGPAIGTIY